MNPIATLSVAAAAFLAWLAFLAIYLRSVYRGELSVPEQVKVFKGAILPGGFACALGLTILGLLTGPALVGAFLCLAGGLLALALAAFLLIVNRKAERS